MSFAEEVVHVKVGLSYVSVANAELNLKQEITAWNIAKV